MSNIVIAQSAPMLCRPLSLQLSHDFVRERETHAGHNKDIDPRTYRDQSLSRHRVDSRRVAAARISPNPQTPFSSPTLPPHHYPHMHHVGQMWRRYLSTRIYVGLVQE